MNKIKLLTTSLLAIGLMACGGAGSASSTKSSSGASRCPSVSPGDIALTVSDAANYQEAMKQDFGSTEGQFQAGKILKVWVGSGMTEKTLQASFVTDKADNVALGFKIPLTAATKKEGDLAVTGMPITPVKGEYHVEVSDGGKVVACRQFTVK